MSSLSWREVGGDLRIATLTMSTTCVYCAQPIPINGPAQVAHCPHCSKDAPVPDLYKVVCLAAARLRYPMRAYQYASFDDPSPECARCGKGIPVAPYLGKEGGAAAIPCPFCGATTPTYPAPNWLKALLPNALQVIGGDADMAREQAGIELAVDESATKPVAMQCPSCGGGLTIGRDADRTLACKFCATNVFIPDALWLRLHPVKTMLRWTLTYRGTLDCDLIELATPIMPFGVAAPLPPRIAAGMFLLVPWSDGKRYAARCIQVTNGQVCVVFPDGRQFWVAEPAVTQQV
jgi:predicted RNA-binding Zn-ribbon protein involved in translation (DUF1610 family)